MIGVDLAVLVLAEGVLGPITTVGGVEQVSEKGGRFGERNKSRKGRKCTGAYRSARKHLPQLVFENELGGLTYPNGQSKHNVRLALDYKTSSTIQDQK